MSNGAAGDATRPRILILATGGTIAGRAHSDDSLRYTSGLVGVEALLQASTGFDITADISAEQIASVGSQDMSEAIWWRLHQRIVTGGMDGVVITHGTDTIEETAFLLDLVLDAGVPVVLVGAMRPGNALGADGPRNLACALRAAASRHARARGVLVVMADMIHSARHVRKALTSGTDGFRSWPGGPIGTASPLGVSFHAPPMPWVMRGRYKLPEGASLPPVGIVYAHAGMDAAMAAAMVASGAAGIVLAGMGHGNAPAAVLAVLADAARRGIAVVRSTRVDEGSVARNLEVDDDASGFIAGGDLSPQKCRLLLQLLIANGVVRTEDRQSAFCGEDSVLG